MIQVIKYRGYDCLRKLKALPLQKQYTPKQYGLSRRRKNNRRTLSH